MAILHAPGVSADGKPDETDLMRRIQSGDHTALDEALTRYWAPLVRYAQGFLHSRDAAEDAAQEAFVRLWKGRGEWTPTGSLQGYLYRILRNHLLNERRAQRVRARWHERVLRREIKRPPTPLEMTEGGELADAVREALEQLPPRRREVFTLIRFHGFSYGEVAETLGISPQTVANHMSAALSALRTRLAPFLPSPDRPHLRVLPGREDTA